jgi:ABC-type multidrug transport system fused ATPase/permease subunit
MSTAAWIIIVLAVLAIIALVVLMPRMRAKSQEQKAKRELGQRRERVATDNREQAGVRSRQAEQAEQKAAAAQQAAERERAEARRLETEADRHERGLADDELIEDHERDRLGPVAGTPIDSDADGRAEGDDAVVQDERSGRFDPDNEARGEGLDEREVAYEQGRDDEREGDRPAARRSDA